MTMKHLYTGPCDTRVLARTMLEDWETEPAVNDNGTGEIILNRHPRLIRDGTEKVSRPCTQQEIPIRLRRLNARARIYKE